MPTYRRTLILLLLYFLPAPHGRAQDTETLQVNVQTGYRSENLRWSIAGNLQGQDPNVYSELVWKGLDGLLCAAGVRWTVYRSLILSAHFSMVSVSGGKATDTDYQGNNRTDVSYSGYFDADRGNLLSGDASLGYRLSLGKGAALIPALGYGADRQFLYVLPFQGNAPAGLQSTYAALWKGFLFSLTGQYPLGSWSLEPSMAYHQVTFDGTADWNLISTFQHPVSFRDHANGSGLVPALKVLYRLHRHWTFSIHGDYGWWRTGAGIDNLYLQNGQTSPTQFNGAKRSGGEAGAGFGLTL